MTINAQELERLSFRLTHQCKQEGLGSAKFVPADDGNHALIVSNAPMVYLWLSPISPNDKVFEPLYVGKAGLGVSQRLRQHQAGFRQSTPGRKNLENIKQIFAKNRKVLVYARKADTQKVLEASINMYSAEEEAIHELYHPIWNRAQFAGGSRRTPMVKKAGSIASLESLCICDDLDIRSVLRGEILAEFYVGLNSANQARLCRLLRWALRLKDSQQTGMKIVLKYTQQPPGYNGVATFLIAKLRSNGTATNNGWILRIPLYCTEDYQLTVTLPTRTKGDRVQENQIARGRGNNFRPLDLDKFLARSNHYTTLA